MTITRTATKTPSERFAAQRRIAPRRGRRTQGSVRKTVVDGMHGDLALYSIIPA
jgi:hypothetical protein